MFHPNRVVDPSMWAGFGLVISGSGSSLAEPRRTKNQSKLEKYLFFRASKKRLFLSGQALTPPLLVAEPLKKPFYAASPTCQLFRHKYSVSFFHKLF